MACRIDLGVDLKLSNAPLQCFANSFLSEKEHRTVAALPEANFNCVCCALRRQYLGLADPRSIEVLQTDDSMVFRYSSVEW